MSYVAAQFQDAGSMHLHFVQSIEPLQGAGLGQSALSLHLAMREMRKPMDPTFSSLVSTRSEDFKQAWPDVIQGVRKRPSKFFYSPDLKHFAANAVAKAEIFHGHGFYVWLNMWLAREARKLGKPLIYHPHGFFDPWILTRSQIKKRFVHWLFEDKNFAYVSWWRALTNKEASQIRSVVGSNVKVYVIPNGVDLAEVDAAKCPKKKCVDVLQDGFWPLVSHGGWIRRRRPRRLLFLSRLHPKKGLDILIPAWGSLSKKFPDWELLIVGPDEGGYIKNLQKLIKQSNCDESCWMHSAVSRSEKHLLLQTANLFVLPSYSEGFPIAVLEAAAHSIPVVMTIDCNFSELADVEGAWECKSDLNSLTNTLSKALRADDIELRERGIRGRELIEEKYVWSKISNDIVEVCNLC